MPQERTERASVSMLQRPAGMRLVVYWCGRIFQMLGLLLIWWVLLLFAGTASMGVLLYWSIAAALVFYIGWGCTTWATGRW